MREQSLSPSLLPYLAPGKGGIGLEIALQSEDPATLAVDAGPFLVIAEADPLTRLIKGAFVTDSGSRIKEVFLLLQRDTYPLATNRLAPLTNADIEDFWQKTYRYQYQHQNGSPLITLQQQLDKQGKLAPFQPLWFCRIAKAYFHPACPACGAPLQLCSNDQLLASLDLPPYSLSLSRYLFCPSCFSSGSDTDFYAHHRSTHDPARVKDCAELVRAFGQLVQAGNAGSGVPCMACPHREECFGAAATAAPPILPFSFYPFHMLIYDAMSLNGLDFVALLAGASFEELEARLRQTGEPGRAAYLGGIGASCGTHHSFFFPDDARLFLEILYLKLTFLQLIVVELFLDPENDQPDPLLFIDRIWVKLTDRAGLQPYLWNFEVRFLDLLRNPLDLPAHPPMPRAYALHLLGLIWFSVLLTNSKQELSQVQRAVERAHDRVLAGDCDLPADMTVDSAYLPENICWHPAPGKLDEGWRHLWEEALRIGWSLLQASAQGGIAGFQEELVRTLDDLRASIKAQLFSERPAAMEAGDAAEAEAIHGILSRLLAKWRQASAVPTEEEWEKTVVLPREVGFETTLPLGEASAAVPDAAATMILATPEARQSGTAATDEEIFEETVILSGKGVREPLQGEAALSSPAADELSETVILGAPGVGGGQVPSPAPSPPVEAEETGSILPELAETVILAPSSRPEIHEAAVEQPGAATPVEDSRAEMVPETVILSPGSSPRLAPRAPAQVVKEDEHERAPIPTAESEAPDDATAGKPKAGEEDDLLSATIILTPAKDRDKK